jgi:hypothetical protein
MAEEELSFNLGFLSKLKKQQVVPILLLLFLIFGFYLRMYHLNFPAIGYHNMKENEYLDQAYFFMNEGNFLHKQSFAFFGFDEGTGYHEEYAQVPLVPYLTAILWALFGEHIWIVRLVMVLFMLGSILLTYFIVKRLTNKEYLSLLSAFLMTIMPLGIYFGRNIQPESPGLFLILLTVFYFLKWIDTKDRKQLMYSGFAFSLAWALKYSFGIVLVPLLFIFPYKEMLAKFKQKRKEFYQDMKFMIYGGLPGIVLTLIYELTVVDRWKAGYRLEPLRIFDSQYWVSRWPAFMAYFNDNFTMWFIWLAIIGLVFVLLKHRTQFSKFLIGYAFSIVLYADAMSAKIGGHAYYQMPYLPLICILSAYALYMSGLVLKQIINNKLALYAPLIIIILAAPALQAANDRVWGTNFYGQDFLGEYLKTRLLPQERFAAATHSQDLATCSYARHRCGFVSTLDEFKKKEQVFNLRYVYVGVSEFNKMTSDDPLWSYIRNNYKIDLVGLMNINGQLTPMHFILKKGGVFSLDEIQGKQPQLAKTYDTKQGPVPYYYIQNI